MEEKNNVTESGHFDKGDSVEKVDFITQIKRFKILTWLGIVLTLIFIIFSFITTTNFKWWLMLSIFIIAFIILFIQKKKVSGVEKGFVLSFLIILLIFFFIRDAYLSEKLFKISLHIDQIKELKNFF
jgi:uncharacterized membrane protein